MKVRTQRSVPVVTPALRAEATLSPSVTPTPETPSLPRLSARDRSVPSPVRVVLLSGLPQVTCCHSQLPLGRRRVPRLLKLDHPLVPPPMKLSYRRAPPPLKPGRRAPPTLKHDCHPEHRRTPSPLRPLRTLGHGQLPLSHCRTPPPKLDHCRVPTPSRLPQTQDLPITSRLLLLSGTILPIGCRSTIVQGKVRVWLGRKGGARASMVARRVTDISALVGARRWRVVVDHQTR